jgi:hypothetical protein
MGNRFYVVAMAIKSTIHNFEMEKSQRRVDADYFSDLSKVRIGFLHCIF